MAVRTGIDIIEVSRIEENIEKFGDKFLQRIYTDREIEYCNSKNVQKYQSYAGRFAAKEAVFKAISGFINDKYELGWKDIEVLNDVNGRPYVNVACNQLISLSGKLEIDISISHVQGMAAASVVAILEE